MQRLSKYINTNLMRHKFFSSAVFVACLACSWSASAITVTLSWDPSEMADRYALFSRLQGKGYDYAHPVWVGSETTWTLSDATDATTRFVVRAYNSNAESGDSNEVVYYPVRVGIKCHRENDPVNVFPGDNLIITVSLDNKGRNDSSDFWLALKGPNGLLFYDGFNWTDIAQPFHQGPLLYVDSLNLLSFPVSDFMAGQYRFYVGGDTSMDGNLTAENLSYDFVDVDLSQ